ncbi:hypothetical protein DAPPUDRAFT_304831 [Daphnia pulex]|uniref:Small integral membrane protein 12 n=1 Tax=Daphnia pulex TaxID=6669 RepID=E9GMA9_DAPPU|nr:hypothetical protein DAPPUDRAFT_304831 [Daphnia pulex]|eukprot:EFX79422.1 hypothetical protein DAPPUDRAFT_304831 [Daphnia pulex]
MWPVLINMLRVNAPYITLPFAAIIGVIGYNIERIISDRTTPFKNSVEEQRDERMLKNLENVDAKEMESLKEKKFVPRTIFEKNVSPSLQTKNT